jgi:hypothetical protein
MKAAEVSALNIRMTAQRMSSGVRVDVLNSL